jgi:hypothetical protein
MVNVAGYYLMKRVTKEDPRAKNDEAMIGMIKRLRIGVKKHNLTRIANMAIRRLTPHFHYK